MTLDQCAEQRRQGSKARGAFKVHKYHWPPRKGGKIATGRVNKSSSWSRVSSSALSTALSTAAPAQSTSTHHLDLVYDKQNTKHQHIVESAGNAIIEDAVNEHCLMDTSIRKQLVLEKLKAAAISEYAEEALGSAWAAINSETLYMDLSVTYKRIMHTCKKIARTVVQRRYNLRPPARAVVSEPEYQANTVTMLIDDMIFPPRFVFGEDEDTHELHFLENKAVWDVVLNTIVELKLYPHLVNLDKMFCAGAAAVKCALMELRTGKFLEIDFTFQAFGETYKTLMDHISTHISLNPGLLKRWDDHKEYTLVRLGQII